jgi:predicted PurR-regulated permease PerM
VSPESSSNAFFSESQRRAIGFALTMFAVLGSAALLIFAFVLVGRLLAFFSSVLWPLAVAGVLALLLRPVIAIFKKRFAVRRLLAVIILYGAFVLVGTGILVLLLPPIIAQLLDFIAYVPTVWEKAWIYVQENYPQWVELAQRQLANPNVRSLADFLTGEGRALFGQTLPSLRAAFGGMFDVFSFITHLAIIPVYLFFFLLARPEPAPDLGQHLPFLRPQVRQDVVFLINEFVAIVESFFRGQLLIGLSMGVLFALGFTLVGLKFGLFIGLALGLFNIIPYLGTILGLLVALPLAFFQPGGGWQLVGLVLVVKAVVQLIESWVLTPKIMGHHTGLHPMMIIVAIFFWGTAFGGVLGMVLAVPLTAFFVTAWRLAKLKYFRPLDA